jgi:hypothetical protein
MRVTEDGAPKQSSTPRLRGRPSDFSEKLADLICERIADGASLRSICAADGMPNKATVFRWLAAHKGFADQYGRAREEQAETLADEIVQIADDGSNDTYLDRTGKERVNTDVISRSKLRVDARKWVASKLKPKKYGDRQVIDVNTNSDLSDEQVAARIAELTARAMKSDV